MLQVCNGKGLTWEDARRSALGEAAELFVAENPPRPPDAFCSARELREAFWNLSDCTSAGWVVAPKLATDGVRCAWTRGLELRSQRPILVPTQALYCAPPGRADLGPAAFAWASNGTGAHDARGAPTAHALLEVCERELLVRALPHGWTTEILLTRRLTPRSVADHAPEVARLTELLEAQNFDVALFDLSPREGLALPLAGAIIVDRDDGPVSIAAGYACRISASAALLSALLEAAQSRLTDIHGAREDVAPMRANDVALLKGALSSASATRVAQAMSVPSGPGAKPLATSRMRRALAEDGQAVLDEALRRLEACGVDRIGLFEVSSYDFPVRVMRVIVPGFRISELLV